MRLAEKLDELCDSIQRCHVTIEAPHRHHAHGKRYNVRIDLTVPGAEIVVSRNPPENLAHEDVHACIDGAFDDAQRRLEDHVRRRRQDVKHHEETPHGRVVHLGSRRAASRRWRARGAPAGSRSRSRVWAPSWTSSSRR